MPDQAAEIEGPQINRGLQGVYFERSQVCDIDGKEGNLWYRGYSIHDLATQSTFEETAFLVNCVLIFVLLFLLFSFRPRWS